VLERDQPIDEAWLRELGFDCGADDVGFVSMDRSEVNPRLLLKFKRCFPS